METIKSPLSIRILFWLTNIAYWLMILISGVVLIFNIVFLTDFFSEDIQLRIQMPVPIEVVEDGKIYTSDSDLTVRIEEANGKLYFVDTPIRITKAVARVLFFIMLLALFITWKFKKFITNLKNGEFFEVDNINNLKHIAYGIVGLWLFTRIYMEVIYRMLVKFMEFESIIIGSDVNDNDDVLLLALGLWVLAHVFAKGVEMKKEQELTI